MVNAACFRIVGIDEQETVFGGQWIEVVRLAVDLCKNIADAMSDANEQKARCSPKRSYGEPSFRAGDVTLKRDRSDDWSDCGVHNLLHHDREL